MWMDFVSLNSSGLSKFNCMSLKSAILMNFYIQALSPGVTQIQQICILLLYTTQ